MSTPPLPDLDELVPRLLDDQIEPDERQRLGKAVGGQQPEVEHVLKGEGMESGAHNGRRWRHGKWIQYTLDPKGAKEITLAVTYSGDDRGRDFDILANGTVIAAQKLTGAKMSYCIEKRYG
ncbi:MAG: DUF6805 domain-containing protein [Phycisphaerales bacterium]